VERPWAAVCFFFQTGRTARAFPSTCQSAAKCPCPSTFEIEGCLAQMQAIAASTGQEAEVQSNADSCGTGLPRQPSKGRGIKWLAKCLFPNLHSKSKCNSSSKEEVGALADVLTKPGPVQAWQLDSCANVVRDQELPDEVLQTFADATACSNESTTSSSQNGSKEASNPVQSEAALAKSVALAKALANAPEVAPQESLQSLDEVCSRIGKPPLPLELLDEPTGATNADSDVDNLLPPLPLLDNQRLDVKADIPGCACESSVPGGEEEAMADRGLKLISQDRSRRASADVEMRPRPASFRAGARWTGLEIAAQGEVPANPSKIPSPHKVRSGSALSMASRPTTAGGETALTFPTSRQSTESTSWNQQWAHDQKQARPVVQKPVRVLASVHVPAQLTRDKPPLPKTLEKKRPPPPQLPLPASQSTCASTSPRDPLFAFALKRASESLSLNAAVAPGVDRHRVRLEKLEAAALEDDFEEDLPEVPIKLPSSEQAEPKSNFSELAVSFASLTDDM